MQTFTRMLWILSLVPEDDVVKLWMTFKGKQVPVKDESDDDDSDSEEQNKIAREYNCKMESFLFYFKQCWIRAKNPRTGVRGRPMFALSTWNK